MAVLVWDDVGDKRYETGLDRAVLYLSNGTAVPWNGLISVVETSGKTSLPVYFDGKKINDIVSFDNFSATMTAVTYPDEFVDLEGTSESVPGLVFGNQISKTFGLCYRTKIGDDVNGDSGGYKIHVLYNLTAVPSDKTYATMSSDTTIVNFEWKITATPEDASAFRPTAHIIINSNDIDPALLTYFEDRLYGTSGADAYLPSMATLIAYIAPWRRWTAKLDSPPDLMAIDRSNWNVYTISGSNFQLSKITPEGIVTSAFATTRASAPTGMAVAPNGTIYVLHAAVNSITKITPGGVVTTDWAIIGANSTAIAVDSSGNVFTCNSPSGTGSPGTISKVTSGGTVTISWATIGTNPRAIAVDPSGNVFTCNLSGNTVSKVTSGGSVTASWATVSSGPQDITTDASGNVFTINSNKVGTAGVISKVTAAGSVTTTFATIGVSPTDLVTDPSGNIYAPLYTAGTVTKIGTGGAVTANWGVVGGYPLGIVADGSGNIFTNNYADSTISKLNFKF